MRILHTSDWHLGVRLENQSREEEHRRSLEWLSQLIVQENIELLVVAGDVFDVYTPANYAQRLYYNFLRSLVNTCCQHVVIVGGNHDSPNLLEASRELLQLLNIHVVAQLPANPEDQIIQLRDPKTHQLRAVVAAVPYIPENQLRKSQLGETFDERRDQIRQAVIDHYQKMAELVAPFQAQNVPIITTGHLYVAGGERGERQNLIHLGHIDLVEPSAFPPIFDYVALGHLHKAHPLAPHRHIRYAGSILPLDFNESTYQHQVYIVDFQQDTKPEITSHRNPFSRPLQLLRGTLPDIQAALQALPDSMPEGQHFKTWLKIEAFIDVGLVANLKNQLQQLIANKPAEIIGEPVQRRLIDPNNLDTADESELVPSLDTISPSDVFALRLKVENISDPETLQQLKDDFTELRTWWDDQNRSTE